MMNKRLISMGDKSHVYKVVACQWVAMVLNVVMVFRLGYQLQAMYQGQFRPRDIIVTAFIMAMVFLCRGMLKQQSTRHSHLAGTGMKSKLRTLLYEKLLRLGTSYTRQLTTAEVLQVSTEGVDQLETYFGSYLPQLFYCMVAPLTLFLVVAPIHLLSAVVLFVCVPLIPISIVVIQKIAKKILVKYWGLYATLGDNFLENVQGMTTLKIYRADETYHTEMNQSAEHFRKITMKVLSMQLNSIIVMDTVAYGGAALGGILAVTALANGHISLMGAMVIILLAAEFFLPMRMLGSFFHIAMNGMAAADNMFKILDMEEPKSGKATLKGKELSVKSEGLGFAYTADKDVLRGIDFTAKTGLTALVGTSGCGKSTIASILSMKERGYTGSIQIDGMELSDIDPKSLHQNVTRVSDQGYIFGGTVMGNLLLAKEGATEIQMISVLKQVQLWDFLQSQNGLQTVLSERGSNFSGGQRQRLNLARALLRDSAIYIFDEVTSNIDAESENAIMAVIHTLAETKTVLLISHRLANVVQAHQILLLKEGRITESGTHNVLLMKKGDYAKLFNEQQALERYSVGDGVLDVPPRKEVPSCAIEVASPSLPA